MDRDVTRAGTNDFVTSATLDRIRRGRHKTDVVGSLTVETLTCCGAGLERIEDGRIELAD